ncbi:hypothetical protein [Roseibium alexandrii]|uniref:Uncharacterized protein n=1 Tax=Roseibium alexandrii TaxID=388408 RepID=A0A0M6ZZV9_9HYPH|nr:hypothetical protein [Roseibium alexandrii]CTQ67084.1 hypothetical protein LAX5112_01206 [Roseibium alexandrii]
MTFRWHVMQIGRALSRLFNACTGGEGDTTTSAYVYRLAVVGGRKLGLPGRWWVAAVDWLLREPGHCKDAYHWHLTRDLFQDDL